MAGMLVAQVSVTTGRARLKKDVILCPNCYVSNGRRTRLSGAVLPGNPNSPVVDQLALGRPRGITWLFTVRQKLGSAQLFGCPGLCITSSNGNRERPRGGDRDAIQEGIAAER